VSQVADQIALAFDDALNFTGVAAGCFIPSATDKPPEHI